jgi:hypothetical protein
VRTVRFDALPAELRKTLVGSFSRSAQPFPLMAEVHDLTWALAGWGAVAASCLLVVTFAFWAELGESYGDFARQGPVFLAGYVALLGLAGAAVGMMVRRVLEHRALPWPPGVYLFGVDLVDARSADLRLFPLVELAGMQPTHHHHNGAYTHTTFDFSFPGETFTFTIRNRQAAEEALDDLRRSLAEVSRSAREGDLATLLDLDPFLQVRLEGGFDALPTDGPPATDGVTARRVPGVVTTGWVWAGGLAALLAVPVWAARDRLGDSYAWAACEEREDRYAAGCWDEVALTTPWSALAHERAGAAAASAITTVTEGRRALEAYGDTEARGAIEARIAGLYTDARERFHAKAAADPQAVAFMDALLGWTSTHPEPIQVRFVPPTVTAMELADTLLKSDPALGGQQYVPIAPHFSPALLRARSPTVVQKLQEGFVKVIPNDVLPLTVGPELVSMESLPTDQPVIAVKVDVSPFGDLYSDSQARKAYAGILMSFDVKMVTPGAEPFGFALQVEPPETFSVQTWSWGGATGLGPADSLVYDTMMARAFEQMVGRTEAAFFAREEGLPAVGGVAADGSGGEEQLTPEQLAQLLKELEAQLGSDLGAGLLTPPTP